MYVILQFLVSRIVLYYMTKIIHLRLRVRMHLGFFLSLLPCYLLLLGKCLVEEMTVIVTVFLAVFLLLNHFWF